MNSLHDRGAGVGEIALTALDRAPLGGRL